jgi:Carbohydrate family 9 binding domain-like/Domain of unknown function (DUF5916)
MGGTPGFGRRRLGVAADVCLALALSGLTVDAVAQNGAAGDKTVRIVRAMTPPVIDGKLDDAVWETAPLIDDFHQVRPTDGGAPSERTEVRLLFDDDYLYIGARLYDGEPDKITRNVMRHGNPLGQDDRLAIVIDPFNTGRNGYRFETNANGVRHDMLYKNINELQPDWTVIWETQSSIDEQGWSFEMAIPFKSLPFNPNIDTWGFNFARGIRRRGEEVVWVSRNRTYNPNIVGHVSGFSGMDQGVGLDIVPSMSANRRRTFEPGTTDTNFEPSFDLYYRVTPSLNASLTVNTDFSATEIDDRQVNLTRFSLFFPEKRDFFLNDSDLFEFGRIGRSSNQATTAAGLQSGRPFFSRRVGLSASGMPVDLKYGGKLSGRVGRFSIGTFAVHQGELGGVDDKNLLISRVAADVLGESSVGMIYTDGDPSSNVDNSLAGADFQYLNTRLAGGRTLEATAWYQRSDTPGKVGDDAAYAVGVDIPNAEGWRGGLSVKQLGENFNPALGFVSRTGVRDYLGQVGYTHFVRGRDFLQSVSSGLDVERVEFVTGGLETQVLNARLLEIESRTRDFFRVNYESHEEVVTQPFTLYSDPTRQVAVPAGRYSFDRAGFEVGSGGQRSLAASIYYSTGDFYDGARTNVGGELVWKSSPRFNFTFRYDWNDIALSQGEFTTRLIQVITQMAIRLNLTWINIVQYDNASEVLGVNSRLQWIPKAGREGFIVLNHNLEDFDKDGTFRSALSDLNVKFSYTFRF